MAKYLYKWRKGTIIKYNMYFVCPFLKSAVSIGLIHFFSPFVIVDVVPFYKV